MNMFDAKEFVLGAENAEFSVYLSTRYTNCGDGCCSTGYATGTLWRNSDKTFMMSHEMIGETNLPDVAQTLIDQAVRYRNIPLSENNTAFYVDNECEWLVSELVLTPPVFKS
jgi:hypothetical protein